MRESRLTAWLCWLLIFSQLLVLVIGHGRIVVCHDEGGTTHIELVDENSCSSQSADACTRVVAAHGENRAGTSCADSACVDVPFGLEATLTAARAAGQEFGQGFGQAAEPNLHGSIAALLVVADGTQAIGRSVDFDDRHAIDGLHRSNRSTVLVL